MLVTSVMSPLVNATLSIVTVVGVRVICAVAPVFSNIDAPSKVNSPDVELTVVVPPLSTSADEPVTLTASSVSTTPSPSVIFSTRDPSLASGIDAADVLPSNR